MSGQTQKWLGVAIGTLTVVAVIVYTAIVGLDKADKTASVLGLLVAIAGFVMAWFGNGRQVAVQQSVETSSVGGGVTQITGTAGSVRVKRHGTPTGNSNSPNPPPAPPNPAVRPVGTQSVAGSAVNESVDQVENTGGDVDIEQSP
ncbi:hypothetical protein [Streptomyces yangpuensis]|uniref:hypothetical protein n=1 Tax=Streptomyces yangpuensis TaxID=1648182 RepID=UPI00364F925F